MRIKKILIFILLSLPSQLLLAQNKAVQLTPAVKASIVSNLTSALIKNYVFLDTALKMAGRVKAQLQNGAYNRVNNPAAFAKCLAADMRAVYNDVHLSVMYNPAFAEELQDKSYVQKITQQMNMLKQARQQNFGLSKVEILSGNIGYIALNAFFEVDDQSKEAIDNAFAFLKNTDALMIDLRLNGGGAANMVKYVCGYFFKDKTHINDVSERRANQIYQYWTEPSTHPDVFSSMPLYILVDGYTVSAAEEFAYDLQCLHRAIIIGETTGGGAHPTQANDISNGFIANIPFARPINPVTKTNWELVGVKPDITTSADSAIDAAMFDCYDHNINTSKDSAVVKSAKWLRFILSAKLHPAKMDTTALKTFCGNYEGHFVVFKNGRLYYTYNGYKTRISPSSRLSFTMDAPLDNRTLDFKKDVAGKIYGITLKFDAETIGTFILQ